MSEGSERVEPADELNEGSAEGAPREATEESGLVRQRRAKLAALREQGNAFPNSFRPTDNASELHAAHGESEKETLESAGVDVSVAGRMLTQRVMGKASFATLRDGSGDIQLFVQESALGDEAYAQFKELDLGDIIGARGQLFVTRTGELTIRVSDLELLTKSLRPLPEKFHGLQDQEIRYRQRYLDLITSEETRRVFRLRSAVVAHIRGFFVTRDFLEVETPMMQVIPGGATARPFVTHHNALDLDLYLRIAPELYLKRLVVGGFERVFEINRNFRNEGLSTRHNPEFTMLEFYQAYATYEELMNLTEELFRSLARDVVGSLSIASEDGQHHYDFEKNFARISLFDSVVARLAAADSPLRAADGVAVDPTSEAAADTAAGSAADAAADAAASSTELAEQLSALDGATHLARQLGLRVDASWGLGKLQTEIFEACVEEELLDPTFITHYPAEVSPLARRNDIDAFVTDRFELFVGGREIANGFSELNDAEDQAARFREQVAGKDAGDEEAMHYDADYVRALEYGMPPTAGEGIGIDRLVMLLAGVPSIRDVVLFPHMRPES